MTGDRGVLERIRCRQDVSGWIVCEDGDGKPREPVGNANAEPGQHADRASHDGDPLDVPAAFAKRRRQKKTQAAGRTQGGQEEQETSKVHSVGSRIIATRRAGVAAPAVCAKTKAMDMSSSYRGLYAYPWDLAEQDPGGFTEELHRSGIDTLCLASSYHAGKFLRPHGASGHVYFPEDGTVHCRIRPERYGRVKPCESSVVAAGDPFGVYASRKDIAVTSWTVLLHNSRLGTVYPDIAVRNAFGDSYPYSLCPCHPDVQTYAVALCVDIADRYPVRGLVLETPGWMAYRHGYHHEVALLGANPWLETHLALCFCNHCLSGAARAGIGAPALRARVAEKMRAYLAAPFDTPTEMGRQWLAADLVTDPELTAFLRWRCEIVTGLVRRIRSEVRADAELFVIPSTQRPTAPSWLEGSDLCALSQAADGLELCLYEPGWDFAVADLLEVRRRVGLRRLRAIIRPGPPDAPNEANFARKVAEIASAGVDGLAFYNFGHFRRSSLGWIGRSLHAAASKDEAR